MKEIWEVISVRLIFYDSTTGKYHRNIYAERNPSVVKELGDVGNDLQIYGDKAVCCNQLLEFYRGDGCGNGTTSGANKCDKLPVYHFLMMERLM